MKNLLTLWMACVWLGCALSVQAQQACQIPLAERKPPDENPPKMGKFEIQEIYLGMSYKELQLTKPDVEARPIVQSGVIYEYFAEYSTKDEQFSFSFTFDGRLYQLIYQKKFAAAVDQEELRLKLIQKYGQPVTVIEEGNGQKVFEACWGQCQMIRDGVFCQNEDTEHWYTYFTAGLGIARKTFSAVLHDSTLYEKNEIGFVERKETQQMAPSTNALENLKL